MTQDRDVSNRHDATQRPTVAAQTSAFQQAFRTGRLYLAVLVIGLLVYGFTAQRGPSWQDSGVFQWRIYNRDLTGWMGLALSHPLLIVLGNALSHISLGSLAWRMNAVSAVFAAIAVANVATLVRRLAPNAPAATAWIAGGILAFAHTFWWLATITESQALHVALFTGSLHALLSLIRRPQNAEVLLLGLLNGLAVATHGLGLLALPALGLMVIYLCIQRQLKWTAVGVMIVGWTLGAGGWLILIYDQAAQHGFWTAIRSALFGIEWEHDVLVGSLDAMKKGFGYIAYNFPNLAIPLMVAGLLSLRKFMQRPLALAMGYMTLVYFVFAIRYTVADQFMFFLPFYAMVAILSGLGLARLLETPGRRWLAVLAAVSVLWTPAIYAGAPQLWKVLNLPLPGRKDLAFRDPARYWLVPWKNDEDSAGRFACAVLSMTPEGSTIITDPTSYHPLIWVRNFEFSQKNVIILEPVKNKLSVPSLVGKPNIFTTSNAKGFYPWRIDLYGRLETVEPGALYRVVWNTATSTGNPTSHP